MRLVALIVTVACLSFSQLNANSVEEDILEATNSFKRFVETNQIPKGVIASAKAVVVIPQFMKAGFFLGGQYGKGIVVIQNEDHSWSNPFFIKVTGGSLGLQFGFEASDTMFVFRTAKSLNELLRNKITLGLEASASVGPYKENYNMYKEANFSDIYTYHIKEGLFAGASFDGAVITHDSESNSYMYKTDKVGEILSQEKKLDIYALRELHKYLNRYTKQ